MPDTDRTIAHAAANGDREARRRLAERLFGRVYGTVTYLAPRHPDRDDFVQQSLIEILRAVGSFQGQSRLERWADRITVRTTLRLLKKRRRNAEVVALFGDTPQGAREPRPDDGLVRSRVALLLQRLSPERRTVMVLRVVLGYSVGEIADLTGAPPNTVRDRLQTGKKQLRKHMLRDPLLGAWGHAEK